MTDAPKPDWADEIASRIAMDDFEYDIAAALRKAKADGMREAAEIMMDETLEGDWGTGVELIRARADKIEKGGA